MKLIVGLGNPGKRYQRTRHNFGFLIVDYIAKEKNVSIKRKVSNALVGEWSDANETFVLIKPQAYMNRSGEPVTELLRRYRAHVNDLVVIYDDLDLPFGRIRIRSKGSAGGHRGVLSIIEETVGAPFYRIRVGIGRPPNGVDPADFVLRPFSAEESTALDSVISRAAEAVMTLVQEGAEPAMARFNSPP